MSKADRDAIDGTPDPLDETPPLLGSWRNIYAVVLGTLAVLVIIFWLVTRAYR